MDRVSCPGPVYRRVELVESDAKQETRRESRRESRPSSTDSGVRRSLTPTRIYQPIPKPWIATTSTGGNLYEKSYAAQEPPKICKKYMQSEIHQSEQVCERGMEQQPYREEHRAYRAEICRREETVCPKPPLPVAAHRPETPREIVREFDKEVMDLRKVKDDTTIDASLTLTKFVPSETEERQGIEGEHDLITETAEEDIGDMHVKKTTTYEKTVEVVSPREGSPALEQIEEVESCTRRSTTKVDRQVTDTKETKTVVESAEVVSSAVDATQLIEQARRDEEERKREEEAEERRKQEEEERKRREEEDRRRREEEERRKKHVSFSEERTAEEDDEEVVEMIREKPIGRTVIHEEKVTESDGSTPGRKKVTKETYEEIVEEVLVQERVKRRDVEEERRKSLREQVEVHQNLRAQGRQPSLQERRIASKYQPHDNMETCKKHVQFLKQTETGPKPISEGPVPNSTPKEWKSEMVNALTTAPDRSYTPLSTSSSVKELYTEETVYLDRKVRPVPKPKERPISPFQRALTIAPERPYTPLSRVIGPEDREVGRTQTPVVQPTPEGVCPPADILYGETRESYRREEINVKKMVPQPLPTPPPDYRLRDSSASPSRSRPCSRADTPNSKPSTVGLRKPDTIPAYQRNLVAMKKGPVEAQPYIPSRTPTPTPRRSKSPAQGPPEPPSYYTKAQAPKIRDDPPWVVKESHPPPSKESSVHFPSRKTVSYTVEEDTDTGHRKAEYMGSKSVHYDERQAEKQQEETDALHAQFQEQRCMTSEDTSEDKDTVCHVKRALHVVEDYERCEKKTMAIAQPPKEGECAIGRSTHVEVTLPCPLKRKPVEKPTTQPTYSSSTEVRHVRYETPTPPPKKCPETGVTVLPCKAHSDHGTKAGVVVVPCEGLPSCPKSGVCVVPTSDRSGVCVSPCFGLKPGCCGQPSGSCGGESGQCDIDIPNCPESGVCVAPCADGSVCVAPCKKSSRQCLRKGQNRTNLPFPQIPLPYEEEGCSQSSPSRSFEPIHKPKTNLSGQLARLTAKNRDIPTVQLYKPQPQCQQSNGQCESQCNTTKSYHCETKSFYQSQSQCQTGNHCQTQSSCQDQFHCTPSKIQNLVDPPNMSSHPDLGTGGLGGAGSKSGTFAGSSAPKRGRGILNQAGGPGSRVPLCAHCNSYVRGPFITALGQIWCPDHFVCVNTQCRRPLQDIGFVEEKGQLYCEYCFEKFIAPSCNKCNSKIKGDCLNAIGKHFHPECFNCSYCGKRFGNSPFFLEEGLPYCEADWNELFTTKCFACGFPVEAGDRWVEALNNNYHSQCFNCTMCKKNLEGQSFYAKGGRPFCKNHAR